MKTLVILKGLAKQDKLGWVASEGLENFFLDQDVIQKLYSGPELGKGDIEILSRSHSTTVYTRFLEILCLRLSKGCLVVVDVGQDKTGGIETLAECLGYTVFYVVFPIPQDYIGQPKKYSIPGYATKKRDELESEVSGFLNLQFTGKRVVKKYQDILDYWDTESRGNTLGLLDSQNVLHVSDIHSNYKIVEKKILPLVAENGVTVFYGDYIDGPEGGGSKKMMEYVISNSGRTTIFLEGNHELRLRKYLAWIVLSGGGRKVIADILYSDLPPEFLETTATEFSGFSSTEAWAWIKEMNRKLKMYVVLERQHRTFLCSHAGIRSLQQINPKYIGNIIYGNRDMDYYDSVFSRDYGKKEKMSIHAHCKYPSSWNPFKYSGVVNLDPPDNTCVAWMIESNTNNFNVCLEKLD